MLRLARRADVIGLLLLPLVAVLARLAYSLALPDRIVITFEADPLTYDQIARNIVAGRGFSGASFYYPPGTDNLTAFWDPLYPYFLSLLYAGFGHSVHVVRTAQAVLGGVSVGLVYLLGRRLAGTGTGVLAAAICAVYPFFVYYAAQLLTETLFMCLILGALVVGLHARHSGGSWWLAVTGALCGLAALCRADAFYFVIVFAAWAAIAGARAWRRRAASLLVAWLCLVGVMLPWGLRNQVVLGQFNLTTTKLGYNLYKYYHPLMTADQTVPTVPFPDLDGLNEPQREAVMRQQGLRFMAERPARTAWFMLNKLQLLFKLTPSNEVNRSYALVSVLSYGVLLPFMVGGFVVAARRGGDWLPVVGYVLFGIATKMAVFAGIRLRMQIEPLLILVAALALCALGARLAPAAARRLERLWSGGQVAPAGA